MIHWGPVVDTGDEPPPSRLGPDPLPPRPGPDPLPPLAPQKRSSPLRELPLLVGLAILIAFVFKTFVAQAFFIPSGSMIPELRVGDRVVVSKVSYRLHDPRRGDVVVFDCPPRAPTRCGGAATGSLPVRAVKGVFEAIGLRQPSTEEYIKRVIGLPGETVQGKDGKVFVNGGELVEPYLPPGTATSDFGPITVAKGQLWVMGDNRTNSADSRVFGTIAESKVVGRAIVRAWPPGRAGFL